LPFKLNIINGLFLQTIVAVNPFSEVLPPKLKQLFQIYFAAVEGVCVLTILTLVIQPVFFIYFLKVQLRAVQNNMCFNKDK
jgi:hypothetical protein